MMSNVLAIPRKLLAYGLLIGSLSVAAAGQQSLAIQGGTYTDHNLGVIGTAFLFDPTTPSDGTEPFVDIQGPPAWNAGNPVRCFLFQPPAMAQNRSACWTFIPPVTAMYTAQTATGRFARFGVVSRLQLLPPEITSLVVTPGEVTLQWTAGRDVKSFLVRVNPLPFIDVTGEIVLSGDARFVTLSGLPLVPGAAYQAVVFAFSRDVRTPDNLVAGFNIGAHGTVFIAP